MHEEERLKDNRSFEERQQAEQEIALHQRQMTDPEQEDVIPIQQQNEETLDLAEQRKNLSDAEDWISKEEMEIRANLTSRDSVDGGGLTSAPSFFDDRTSSPAPPKGHISLGKEGRRVSIAVPFEEAHKQILQERLRNRAGELGDVAITLGKDSSKIKFLKARLWDCEKSFRRLNSGLEIAMSDIPENDPQRAMKVAALYQRSYLPMKENLERVFVLMMQNNAAEDRVHDPDLDRVHAILLAKLAARTMEIASRLMAMEYLNPVNDHESIMLKESVDDICRNLVDLINVLNASQADIGTKLREGQIKIAERALLVADKKFRSAFRKKKGTIQCWHEDFSGSIGSS